MDPTASRSKRFIARDDSFQHYGALPAIRGWSEVVAGLGVGVIYRIIHGWKYLFCDPRRVARLATFCGTVPVTGLRTAAYANVVETTKINLRLHFSDYWFEFLGRTVWAVGIPQMIELVLTSFGALSNVDGEQPRTGYG